MKFLLALVIFLTGSYGVVWQSATAGQGRSKDEASTKVTITELERQWSQAYVKKDHTFLNALLADDFSFISSEGKKLNKQQVLADLDSSSIKVESAAIDDIEVRVYGTVAVVVETETVKGSDKSGPFTRKYRYTDTFVKTHGNWRCVASHETEVAKE